MDYSIKNDIVSITASEIGGELKTIKSSDGTDYLWTGSKEYWQGSAPNLFPFIGRLYEGKYLYNNESYPLAIHGFLRESKMTVNKTNDSELEFSLESNEDTYKMYPFNFDLVIRYTLCENAVKILYQVHNKDEKDMPFAIGGHPGFCVPLNKDLSFDDYYLEFSHKSTPKRTEPTSTALLNGNYIDFPLEEDLILRLNHSLFDNDAIVLKDIARSVLLKSDKDSRAVRVDYTDFQYLGIWHTNKTEAPFICIEPWTALQGYEGIIQEIDKNDDMIVLKHNEVYKNEWVITIIE